MNLKTSIPLMVLSLIIEVAADSGYGATCNSIQYYNGRNGDKPIFANCRETSGIYNVDSQIDTRSCFANANGNLVGRLWGGYQGSCTDVDISGTILHANCKNDAGNYVYTTIDTNDWIGNYDGVMKCFGQTGY